MIEQREITPKSVEFFEQFKGRLNELLKTEGLPPGVAITLIANLNFHGQDIPADIFEGIDYSNGYGSPDNEAVLKTVQRMIQDGQPLRQPVREKIDEEFSLQYNFIRGFRPLRGARRLDIALNEPIQFDNKGKPKGFNYTSEECTLEKFTTLPYDRMPVDILFNRYPFAPYHFLWVPNRIPDDLKDIHNQFLDPEKDKAIIQAAWDTVTKQGFGQGIRLCYNSNGAHASANHLHFQGFFITQGWEPPFEKFIRFCDDPSRKLKDCYFKGVRWLSKSDGAPGLEDFISEMNRRDGAAYNLCLTPSGIACFPRKHQADEEYSTMLEQSKWTTGYAFLEMLGEIISPTQDVLDMDKIVLKGEIRRIYDILQLGSNSNVF